MLAINLFKWILYLDKNACTGYICENINIMLYIFKKLNDALHVKNIYIEDEKESGRSELPFSKL